jgi:hypothetical protein
VQVRFDRSRNRMIGVGAGHEPSAAGSDETARGRAPRAGIG